MIFDLWTLLPTNFENIIHYSSQFHREFAHQRSRALIHFTPQNSYFPRTNWIVDFRRIFVEIALNFSAFRVRNAGFHLYVKLWIAMNGCVKWGGDPLFGLKAIPEIDAKVSMKFHWSLVGTAFLERGLTNKQFSSDFSEFSWLPCPKLH